MKSICRRFIKRLHHRNSESARLFPALESLESRLLFSAAPVETPLEEVESPGDGNEAPAADVQVNVQSAQAATAALTETETAAEIESTPLPADGETEIPVAQGVTLLEVDHTSAQLNQETLDAVAEAAAERWRATGLTTEQSAALEAIDYRVDNLANFQLGVADGHSITLDDDAGGRGWFIDGTPLQDEEFTLSGDGILTGTYGDAAIGHDLLTVLLHEQGHVLGIDDHAVTPNPADVMTGTIGAGMRRLPAIGQAESAVPGSIDGAHFAISTLGTPASAAGDTTDTVGFTLAAGTERLLVVFVLEEFDDIITDVTFNGVSLTEHGGVIPSGDFPRMEAWYAVMGDSVSGTTANVVMTTHGGNDDFASVVAAVAFEGVDQATPVDAIVTSNTSLSTTVTSAVGDLVVGSAYNFGGANALGAGPGQTAIHTHNAIDVGFGPGTANFITTLEAGAASVNMTHTAAGTIIPMSLAFNINAATPPALNPEIKIEHDLTVVEIPDGDITPTGVGDEGTYYGSVDTAAGMVTRTFRITNTGNANLNLTGATPVTVTDGTHFSVTQPASLVLAPLASTTFTVTFNPATDGLHNTTVHVASDDADEGDYDFRVEGIGTTLSPTSITQLGAAGSTSNHGDPFGTTTTTTLPFTVDAGTNRLLVVFAHEEETVGNADLTGVTFQSTAGSPTMLPLTSLILGGEATDASGFQQTEIYYLALGSGGAITGNIVMSTNDLAGDNEATILTAVAYENVDQTTPVDGFVSTNGSASDSALNVVSEAGDRVVSVHANQSLSGATADPVADAAQTVIHDLDAIQTHAYLLTSTEPGGVLIDTLHSWNSAPPASQNFVTAALNINAAPPAASTTEVTLVSGDLVVTDVDGADTDDNLLISRTGGNFIIEDLDGNTVGTSIAGATQATPSRVIIPDTSVTGGLIVNTLGGADLVTLDDLGTLDGVLTILGGADQDRIVQNAGATATLTGANAVTFTAEQIEMRTGSNLTTATGGVTLSGTGGTGNIAGVTLDGASIDSASGDVNLTGQGGDTGHYNRGILLDTDTVTTTASSISTAGAITLTGTGGGGGNHGSGVTIIGGTVESTGTGPVTLIGTGGTGLLFSEGVAINSGATVDGGTGDIVITGTGGVTGNMNRGVNASVTDLITNGGNIVINGTGGGTMMYGIGVDLNDVDASTSGSGAITFNGTGAAGTLGNIGVKIASGSIVNTVNGAISITGEANGNSTLNHGVQVTTATQIAATGTGAITMTGTGGAGTTTNHGIAISAASSVSVADGNLTATGLARGTVSLNKGLEALSSTLTSTGTGNIALTGTGSASGTGVYNTGISISAGGITTAAGNVVLNGVGGTGTTLNEGIRIASAGIQSTGGGDLSITGEAKGTTTGVYNTGTYLLTTNLDSAGVIDITGTGGGGTFFNHGIYMQNVTTPGSAPATAGTAGGGTSEDEAGNFFP